MNSTAWIFRWAQACLGHDITEADLETVRNFVLLWNIFETRFFENKATGNKVWRASIKVSKEICVSTFDVIRSRYVSDDGSFTNKYAGLFLGSDKELERRTKEILLAEKELTDEDRNEVCRIVIWRYRCNLFHGNKNAYYMLEDNKLFEYLNQYLINVLEQQ